MRSGVKDLQIRVVGQKDLEALLDMYRGFEPLAAAQGLPPVSEEGRREWLIRLLEEAHNLAAFDSRQRLVGHVVLAQDRPAEAEIAFFVHQDCRRQRIGTRLVETALGQARELGFGRVWASVLADNVPALHLLRKHGFAPSYVSLPTVEVDLRLPLPQPASTPA